MAGSEPADETERTDESPTPSGAIAWETLNFLREHPAILISGLASLAVVTRLMSVTGWDSYTALAVLNAQGSGNVLVGSLAPFVTFIPVVGFNFCMSIAIGYLLHRHIGAALWWFTGVAIFALAIAALYPWPMMAVFIVAFTTFVLLFEVADRRDGITTEPSVRGATEVLLASGVALLFIVLSPQPWLPLEAIRTGNNVGLIGYVLKTENDQMVVLTDRPRGVTRIESSNVLSRQYCKRRLADESSFGEWINRQPSLDFGPDVTRYPSCSDLIKTRAPTSVAP
jgi:hypothetical protein